MRETRHLQFMNVPLRACIIYYLVCVFVFVLHVKWNNSYMNCLSVCLPGSQPLLKALDSCGRSSALFNETFLIRQQTLSLFTSTLDAMINDDYDYHCITLEASFGCNIKLEYTPICMYVGRI